MQTKLLAAKIHNLKFWTTECDPQVLRTSYQKFLEQAEFVILNCSDHHFPVQGYTVFWLLAESHLAIHTFPNEGRSYVELSSCNRDKAQKFFHLIQDSNSEVEWDKDEITLCTPQLSDKIRI
jgi:S-adenosylmethionine decarboxylase